MPSPEVQKALLRINDVGARLLRQRPTAHNFDAITAKIDQLEQAIGGPDRSPKAVRAMIDSGYGDDFDTGLINEHSPTMDSHLFSPTKTSAHAVQPDRKEENTSGLVQAVAHRDGLLAKAQSVLVRVTKVHDDLQRRFDEIRDLSERQADQIEEATSENLKLRSENEALKADLAFDHSELLYLQLQLKSLEVQADELYEEQYDEGDPQRERQVLLADGLDQWHGVWDDVNARQRGRRVTHRVTSSQTIPNEIIKRRHDGRSPDSQGDWKLDMSRKRDGQMQSITIRRFSASGKDLSSQAGVASVTNSQVESTRSGVSTQTEPMAVADVPALAIFTTSIHSEEPTSTHSEESSSGHAQYHSAAVQTDSVTAPQTISVSTQTDKKPSAAVHFSPVATIHEDTGNYSEEDSGDEDVSDSRVEEENEVVDIRKSAWQELMASLSDFSGMSNY